MVSGLFFAFLAAKFAIVAAAKQHFAPNQA